MVRKSLKKTSKPVYNLPAGNYLGKIENEINSNQSKLSMILGGLIILVIGILIFNYFSKNNASLGPAQQTEQNQEEQQEDVTVDNLPGIYTVKTGDTLFLIAEKYYKDGDKFTEIAKVNNLSDANIIELGQKLKIPKLPVEVALTNPDPSPTAEPTPAPTPAAPPQTDLGTGGGDTTIWGSKIEGTTYTVQEGDWLSTISARAYGDIFSYQKLAAANSIQNPDYIIPGMVLTIPR